MYIERERGGERRTKTDTDTEIERHTHVERDREKSREIYKQGGLTLTLILYPP